jgi:hypothetical protein
MALSLFFGEKHTSFEKQEAPRMKRSSRADQSSNDDCAAIIAPKNEIG